MRVVAVVAAMVALSCANPQLKVKQGNMVASVDDGHDVIYEIGGETVTVKTLWGMVQDLQTQLKDMKANVDDKLEMVVDDLEEKMENLTETMETALENTTAELRVEVAESLGEVETRVNDNTKRVGELDTGLKKAQDDIKEHNDQFNHTYRILQVLTDATLTTDTNNKDLEALSKSSCHERGMGYKDGACVDCHDGYDPVYRACRAEGFNIQPTWSVGSSYSFPRTCSSGPIYYAGARTTKDIWHQNFHVGEAGKVQIYFKAMTYQYGTSGCWSDREASMTLYPVIDGVRLSTYCGYNYIRGWGRNDREHSDFICDFTVTLSEGDHTLTYDMDQYGYQNILYSSWNRAISFQRALGKISATPAAEKTTSCKANTGNVLIDTYQVSDRRLTNQCGRWSGWGTFNTQFANKLWRVTTRTGIVHVYYKSMTYLYGRSCGSSDAGVQVQFMANKKALGTCNYNYVRGWYNYDNEHKPFVCSFTYKTTPGTQILFEIQSNHYGYDSRLYGNNMRSVLRLEDLPPASTTQPDVMPTGCLGATHRRIIYNGQLKRTYTTSRTTGKYTTLSTSYVDTVKFTVSQTSAKIRIYFKFYNYLYGVRGYSGTSATIRLFPVFNGKRQSDCSYNYIVGDGSYNDNAHMTQTCDITTTFSKGTHTITWQMYTYGYNAYAYGGVGSHYMVEEIPFDDSTSTIV